MMKYLFVAATLAAFAFPGAALAEKPDGKGEGIDTGYDSTSKNDKSDDNAAVSQSFGSPYSKGNIGYSGPDSTTKPRGTRDVGPGWGTLTAPGQN